MLVVRVFPGWGGWLSQNMPAKPAHLDNHRRTGTTNMSLVAMRSHAASILHKHAKMAIIPSLFYTCVDTSLHLLVGSANECVVKSALFVFPQQ